VGPAILAAAESLAVISETREEESNEPVLVSSGGKRDPAVHLLWRGVKGRFKGSLGLCLVGVLRLPHASGALHMMAVHMKSSELSGL
jgi:hypothetical protein